MIAIKAPKLPKLQAEFSKAPALYRRAMLRALSTTKRDTKADATKIAQTIYTAGRNKISASLSTTNVDKSKLTFQLVGLRRGISLVDFKHRVGMKRGNRQQVAVQVLKAKGFSTINDTIKKIGSKSGKLRLIQFQRSGPLAAIALASSSPADMLNREEVAKRLKEFSEKKMSNELARQIALVFK